MTSIKDRILQIPIIEGVKKEYFFKKINSSYSNFRGKSKISSPSADVIVEISTNYPKINIEWLLTGKGDPLKTPLSIESNKRGVPYFDIDFVWNITRSYKKKDK